MSVFEPDSLGYSSMWIRQKQVSFIVILTIVMVAVLLLYFSLRERNTPSPDEHNVGSEGNAKDQIRIARGAKLKVIIEEPRLNARLQLGEELHVKGYLEVPEGQAIFEKEVYLQNLVIRHQATAALFSCLVPLRGSDGHYSFEIALKGSDQLAQKPGTYEIKITAPSLVTNVLSNGTETMKDSTGDSLASSTAAVRYNVVRRPVTP